MAILPAAPALSGAEGPAGPALEDQVKIAFLYNFGKFVEWPREVFPASDSPLIIGIVGADPFCDTVERTLRGKAVGGRPLLIRRFRPEDRPLPTQILFLSPSIGKATSRILGLLNGAPVLTVGDSTEFLHLGGIITFRMENNKVRFEINVDAAERAGLKLSSKLLQVATVVRDGTGGGD